VVAVDKTVYFPNWISVAEFARGNERDLQNYREQLRIPSNALVALYSGNMGNKQGLEILAELAKRCAKLSSAHLKVELPAPSPAINIIFVFCGNGPGRADLFQRCQHLENVRFLDLQSTALLPSLLALADIHLLPQRADVADLVMPSKLTGMLASGRPVVATAKAGTELATVVKQCGIVVPPEDPDALTSAVLTLANDKALRAQLGAAGQRYAKEQLDADAVLKQFEEALISLCGGVKVGL
jgi:colanic acid biosynthesis glycosyl transferase WcaI